MNNLQTFIAGFDLTTLSTSDQARVNNLMIEIVSTITNGFLTNPATTSDQINNVLNPISTAQQANKQITAL